MKFLRYIEIFVVQDVEIFDYTIENWFSIESNAGKIMMIPSIEFQLVLFNEKAKHFEHEHLQAISILKCTNVIYYFKLVTEWVGEWVWEKELLFRNSETTGSFYYSITRSKINWRHFRMKRNVIKLRRPTRFIVIGAEQGESGRFERRISKVYSKRKI